jgi:hypothetical protein
VAHIGDKPLIGAAAKSEKPLFFQHVVPEKRIVATRPQQAWIPPTLALFRFPKPSISD